MLVRLLGPVDVVDDDGTVHAPESALTSTTASLVTSTSDASTIPATSTASVPHTTAANDVTTTTTSPTEGTTAATKPSVAADGSLDAFELLATIPVELEHPSGYSRDLFAVWLDLDGDGCDTRAEVLIAESLTPAQVDQSGCTVISGTWFSAYDGITVTSPADLDVDHVVSLKEAWDSGAWQWTPERRIGYGNDTDDPRVLAAVTATSNREKGDKDPSNWLPPDTNTLCTYLGDWISIKAQWQLSMDQSEWGRIKNQLRDHCPDLRIYP